MAFKANTVKHIARPDGNAIHHAFKEERALLSNAPHDALEVLPNPKNERDASNSTAPATPNAKAIMVARIALGNACRHNIRASESPNPRAAVT